MKTKEEKAQYCREWRIKNREAYLLKKRYNYQKNKDKYREKAKERASLYYYTVLKPKREARPDIYRKLDRLHSIKRQEVRRKHLKELRAMLGGKCVDCGYNKHVGILQFHHHEKNKEMNVTEIQSYKKRESEAKKCILLCPNCHAIRHLNSHV